MMRMTRREYRLKMAKANRHNVTNQARLPRPYFPRHHRQLVDQGLRVERQLPRQNVPKGNDKRVVLGGAWSETARVDLPQILIRWPLSKVHPVVFFQVFIEKHLRLALTDCCECECML